MRLIPSISPEASVSGQGKQGMTPSGAHQCCSASSFVQEAGLRLEQSTIRNLQGLLVGAAISWVCGCGHITGAAGHGELGARAASKVLATTCAKAAVKAGGVPQVTPPRGCIHYPRMLSEHVPPQRCPRKGMFEPRLG